MEENFKKTGLEVGRYNIFLILRIYSLKRVKLIVCSRAGDVRFLLGRQEN